MNILTQLAIAGLIASSAAGGAIAGVGAQQPSSEAPFASLDLHSIDLQSSTGQHELKRRLKASVKERCKAFSNQAAGAWAGPSNGRVGVMPVVQSPRDQCVRKATRYARFYRQALVERAAKRD